jgi:hypothetical protein
VAERGGLNAVEKCLLPLPGLKPSPSSPLPVTIQTEISLIPRRYHFFFLEISHDKPFERKKPLKYNARVGRTAKIEEASDVAVAQCLKITFWITSYAFPYGSSLH